MNVPSITSSLVFIPFVQPQLSFSKQPEEEHFMSLQENIELLFWQLEKAGMFNRLGILGNYSFPEPPCLCEESLAKLKEIRTASIPICEKSGTLLYELNQDLYVKDFNTKLKEAFKTYDSNVSVRTYLRGGAAEYITDVFSYIEVLITHYFKSFQSTDQETITLLLEKIKADLIPKTKPKDIDWLDSITIETKVSNLPFIVKDLFIQCISEHSNGALDRYNTKARAFQKLTTPKSDPLFPTQDISYASCSLGDKENSTDRASGTLEHPFLFSRDDFRYFVAFNGSLCIPRVPESHTYSIWQVIIDKFFEIDRLMPHHLPDFRSSLVALDHVTKGGCLEETDCKLHDVFFAGLSHALNDLNSQRMIHQLILDRFIKHSVNGLSYFINLFLYFQFSIKGEPSAFISELWFKLKKEILPKLGNISNQCPITCIIFQQLNNEALNYDVFCQSLYQLMLFLSTSSIDRIPYKCSTSSIGTPFTKFQFNDHLIIFPYTYGSLSNPNFPFIFDKFIQTINPSFLIKKPISEWVSLELHHQLQVLFSCPLLANHKLYLLFLLATKPAFVQVTETFKVFLRGFVLGLVEANDPFDIPNILFQFSPTLFNDILTQIDQAWLEKVNHHYKLTERGRSARIISHSEVTSRFVLNESTSLESILLSPNWNEPLPESIAREIAWFILKFPNQFEKETEQGFLIYHRIKQSISTEQKLQLYQWILKGHTLLLKNSDQNIPHKSLKDVASGILENTFYQNSEILSLWKEMICAISSPLDFLHPFLIDQFENIGKRQEPGSDVFMGFFLDLLASSDSQGKCLEYALLKELFNSATAENISMWIKILSKISWDAKRVQVFLENFPKLKTILQNPSLKTTRPILYENFVKGIPSSSSSNHVEACYFLHTLLEEEHPQDWDLLNLLQDDLSKLPSILDRLSESSENIQQAKPYIRKIVAASPKNKGLLTQTFQEKIIRLWPNCIDLNFIKQAHQPEKVLERLLKSSSSEALKTALSYFSDKTSPKTGNKNALLFLAFSIELGTSANFDVLLKIIRLLEEKKCKELLNQHQDELLLKMEGNSPFQENVEKLLSLLNEFQIPSSEQQQLLLLNLFKQSLDLDQCENTASSINLCLQSEAYSRFPSSSDYLALLLKLFSQAKKEKLRDTYIPLLTLLKPLMQKSPVDGRLNHLEVALTDLTDDISLIFLWALPLCNGSELSLIDFFMDQYKELLQTLPIQDIIEIAKAIHKYPAARRSLKSLTPQIKTEEMSSKIATSLLDLFVDENQYDFKLLSQLIPKIENTEKLLGLFNGLNIFRLSQSHKESEFKLCLGLVLDTLYKKKEKEVIQTLITALDLLDVFYKNDNERGKKFFFLYKEAKKYLKSSSETDLPFIEKLLTARQNTYRSKEDSWIQQDFESLNAFDLIHPLSHDLFLNHFHFSIRDVEHNSTNLKKICFALTNSIPKMETFTKELKQKYLDLTQLLLIEWVEAKEWAALLRALLEGSSVLLLPLVAHTLHLKKGEKGEKEIHNSFLKQIIDSQSEKLHVYVHDNLLDLSYDPSLLLTFHTLFFTHLACKALKRNQHVDYVAALKVFQPSFIQGNDWPSFAKYFLGYFLSIDWDNSATDESRFLFIEKFYSILLYEMDLETDLSSCHGFEIPARFFDSRKTLSSDIREIKDSLALKFVKNLIVAFHETTRPKEHHKQFFSFLGSYLSRCMKEKISFKFADIYVFREVMYAHIAMAKAPDDFYVQQIEQLMSSYFKLNASMNSEFRLETELLLKAIPKNILNSLQHNTKIVGGASGIILQTLEKLSIIHSALSILYMIRVLNFSKGLLEKELTNWIDCYQFIFNAFKDIQISDTLFASCILSLDVPFTELRPGFLPSAQEKVLFLKVIYFHEEYFGKDNSTKANGIFPMLSLLEAALTNQVLTHAQYLKFLGKFFDWSLIPVTDDPSCLTEAFYDSLTKETPFPDKDLNSMMLHNWIFKLLLSSEQSHKNAGKYFFYQSYKILLPTHYDAISTYIEKSLA